VGISLTLVSKWHIGRLISTLFSDSRNTLQRLDLRECMVNSCKINNISWFFGHGSVYTRVARSRTLAQRVVDAPSILDPPDHRPAGLQRFQKRQGIRIEIPIHRFGLSFAVLGTDDDKYCENQAKA